MELIHHHHKTVRGHLPRRNMVIMFQSISTATLVAGLALEEVTPIVSQARRVQTQPSGRLALQLCAARLKIVPKLRAMTITARASTPTPWWLRLCVLLTETDVEATLPLILIKSVRTQKSTFLYLKGTLAHSRLRPNVESLRLNLMTPLDLT